MTKGQEKDLEALLANGKRLVADYPELLNDINEPRYSIGDIGLNSRTINYWEKKGLFIKEHNPRRRKKFDLIDSIWMKMIQKMRQFGISLISINNVKEILVEKVEVSDLNKEVIEKIILDLYPDDELATAQRLIRSKEFSLAIKDMNLSLLQIIVMDVLLFRNQYSLLLNSNGELIPFKINEIEYLMQQKDWRKSFSNSHISISVNEMLESLVDELGEVEAVNIHILSREEVQILNSLKEKGVKTVEIKISQDGSRKAEKIILTKREVMDDSKRLKELIIRNKYEIITINSENGKIVYCERKEKRKIK